VLERVLLGIERAHRPARPELQRIDLATRSTSDINLKVLSP
jgi:hypothetical protein